jgi:hypothetical protein
MIAIPSATHCPCGQPVLLMQINAGLGRRWQAHCDECALAPPPRTASIAGYGESPEEALWDWQVTSDLERGVRLVPVSLLADIESQVREESERQRGWIRRDGLGGTICYGPPPAPVAPEQAA